MQIHVALDAPLRWRDRRLDRVPIVHLSGRRAERDAGLRPGCRRPAARQHPTIVVGQPSIVDTSRAAGGPRRPVDPAAAGPLRSAWRRGRRDRHRRRAAGTSALTQAFTERVLARLAPHVENWPDVRLATATLSPVEIERRNPNLVRGDIYSGDCELGQSYLWRPLPGYGSHLTPVGRLYQCGASTHPGPGLNAASGRIVGLGRQRRAKPCLARARSRARAALSRSQRGAGAGRPRARAGRSRAPHRAPHAPAGRAVGSARSASARRCSRTAR